MIDTSTSVQLTFDGWSKILMSFPISHVRVKFMPSFIPHRASFTDSFPIKLKLQGSFFFRAIYLWNIALQLPTNAFMSFFFNLWGYDNLIKLVSLKGFSLSSRICRLLILETESSLTRGSNIGVFSFSLNWVSSVDCTPSTSSFLRWVYDKLSHCSPFLISVRMYPTISCTTVSGEDLFGVFSFLSCSCHIIQVERWMR